MHCGWYLLLFGFGLYGVGFVFGCARLYRRLVPSLSIFSLFPFSSACSTSLLPFVLLLILTVIFINIVITFLV